MAAAERDDRLYKKDRRADQRTPGQRDRDRVLYTSALRRLAAITQVVSPTEGSVFHNRLTHSLEVAQIGRRLAEDLLNRDPGLAEALGGVDPERVEAAALAHDLGHPPFGHIAEKKLDELVVEAGVADGFESNAQAFRIVAKLAVRDEEFPGLNLTRATLNALLKYPWLRRPSGRKHDKWGVYSTEETELDWVKKPYSSKEERTAEAELMDWADDVAYAVHDLEDFYRAGLIPVERLVRDEDERQSFLATALDRLHGKTDYSAAELEEAFREVVEPSPLSERYQGTRRQRAGIRSFTASLIGKYIRAISFVEKSAGGYRVQKSPRFEKQVLMLKELTWHYVITNPALETQQYGQRRIVSELFGMLAEAASARDAAANRGIFPTGHQEQLAEAMSKDEKIRVVADVVASMTEQQALKMHQRLTGASPGSVMDII